MLKNCRYHILLVGLVLAIVFGLWTIFGTVTAKSGLVTRFHSANIYGKPAPLVLLFGGSEGGLWNSRSRLVSMIQNSGVHVLRVGYFGLDGIPKHLNRIDLGQFKTLLHKIENDPRIIKGCIGIIGVSKGAELALNVASRNRNVHLVAVITPAHVSFQASNVTLAQNSSWVSDEADVAYVPYKRISRATLKGVLSGEHYLDMHLAALRDKSVEDQARIAVETINGPILLISAKHDQMWPSTYMADEILKRRKAHNTVHSDTHIVWDSNHYILNDPYAIKRVVSFVESIFSRANRE